MEGSRNRPMCRPGWGEARGQSVPGILESRFQGSHIPWPGNVVSQGPGWWQGPGSTQSLSD